MTAASPGWFPDPLRRYEWRYWDGRQWTDVVASQGRQLLDPLPRAEPTPVRAAGVTFDTASGYRTGFDTATVGGTGFAEPGPRRPRRTGRRIAGIAAAGVLGVALLGALIPDQDEATVTAEGLLDSATASPTPTQRRASAAASSSAAATGQASVAALADGVATPRAAATATTSTKRATTKAPAVTTTTARTSTASTTKATSTTKPATAPTTVKKTTTTKAATRTTSADAVRDFANCRELNGVYPHGVGRPGSVDRTRNDSPPVTTFLVDAALYEANSESDGDNDGVACEKR